MNLWPFNAYWVRHQSARLHNADLSGLPRELNPYERLVVRFVFAEGKVLLLVPPAAVAGYFLQKYVL